jgi:hypothetical protein
VKIRHIVGHFDRLVAKPAESVAADPEQVYYMYLTELASRQYDVLRAASVIQHDQNVDRAFERGVRYAFATLLGHPALQFTGNAHADGGISASRNRMVLWDCKSALTPYALTEPKSAQFLQYVHKEAPNIVCPFVVFAGSFTADSEARALALKARCPPGTEIALMKQRIPGQAAPYRGAGAFGLSSHRYFGAQIEALRRPSGEPGRLRSRPVADAVTATALPSQPTTA